MNRKFLCLALALILAVLAGRDAALAYWRGDPSANAPALLAGDPLIRLRRSESSLAARGQLARSAPAIRDAASEVLRATPLSAFAMRQLGAVANMAGGDAGLARLVLAERISRRDLPSELLLIEASARNEDPAATLRHYDHALSVYPSVQAELFPLLASELSDPEVRLALARYTAKPWLRDFAVNAADYDVPPAALMEFYAEIEGKLAPRELQDGTLRMLRWLQANGQFAAMPSYTSRIPGLPAQTLQEFGFSTVTTDERLAPLSWTLRNDGAIEAFAEGNRLTIRIAPENAVVAATRTTLLAPGTYAVSQSIEHEANAPRARLIWQVTCHGGPAAPLWQQELPVAGSGGRYVADFTVPPGCPAQAWQLQAAAAVSQFASTARIAGLALKRR